MPSTHPSEPADDSQQPPEIDAVEAARLSTTGQVTLLDVREADEWDLGHADGALHVPLGLLDPTAFSTGRPVIAVCRSGNRSGKAALQLQSAGVKVSNLTGGMRAWKAAGLPVVAADGSTGDVD